MKRSLVVLFAGLMLASVSSNVRAAEALISPIPDMSIYSNNSFVGSVFGVEAETKRGRRVGQSVCKDYLGIVKLGSCGVGESMKNGNLSVLKYVDVYKKGWFFNRSLIINAYGD